MLSDGSTWLASVLDANEAVDLVYRRRQQPANPIEIVGTQGVSEYLNEDAGPVQREWRSADFLITASRLTQSGVRFEPEPGDRIETTINGTARVYEVMQPGVGIPCFRYGQPEEITIRVHTKRVKA